MKLKTLKINGKKIPAIGDYPSGKQVYLEGSTREILAYFLFPKKLNGVTKRGYCIVEQTAKLNTHSEINGTYRNNYWENSSFLPFGDLENKTISTQI